MKTFKSTTTNSLTVKLFVYDLQESWGPFIAAVLKVWPLGDHWDPFRVSLIPNYFHNHIKILFTFFKNHVNIFSDGTRAMMVA